MDDTVIDKRYAVEIELSKRQYSGNEHSVIQGIGLVNCIYVNYEVGKFWVVDYRIYDPDRDGKTKIDHVTEMLSRKRIQRQMAQEERLWYEQHGQNYENYESDEDEDYEEE